MALLYYWRGDNYFGDIGDLAPGEELSLQQDSPVFSRGAVGEGLWAFTRRADGRYVLAASFVIGSIEDQLGLPYRYGRYRAVPLEGSTVLYEVAEGEDIEPLIRSLPLSARGKVLGHSFQGHAAVRALDTASEGVLAEFAARQRVLPGWDSPNPPDWGGASPGGSPPLEDFDPATIQDGRQRTLRAIAVRQGQGAFRTALMEAYGSRCAVTGCATTDVLEAAHILPYRGPATNHPTNGLLLRADIHTLFDVGLLGVDPATLTILVSSQLGEPEYAALAGRRLRLPADTACQPSARALLHHRQVHGL